jgi:tRNA (guanine-N7-)-methyltransferase
VQTPIYSPESEIQTHPHIRTFHARHGRMSARRDFALKTLLPPLEISDLPRPVDLRETFGLTKIIIDFGSGMGDHALNLAKIQNKLGILAIDVHTAGLCEVAQFGHEAKLSNIRVHHGDGIDVLRGWLMPNSISEIHILFPDPWPKIRHHKRRLIQQDFIDLMANVLQPNGVVRFVTDDLSYFEHACLAFEENMNFESSSQKWDIPLTVYHKRALRLGHTISSISFRKLISS